MKTLEVADSDVIRKLEFDDDRGVMIVTFTTGSRYEYEKVPWKVFVLFVQVEDANRVLDKSKRISIGRMFHYSVRMHNTLYPAKELT